MYSLEDLAVMTGLTDRTLRNYLKHEFLIGEKEDGKWLFTDEQVAAFLEHPAVIPALRAKRNSVVFDFLANDRKQKEEACVILDWPEGKWMELSEFFCNAVNARNNMRMFLHNAHGNVRAILSGETGEVLEVIEEYRTVR